MPRAKAPERRSRAERDKLVTDNLRLVYKAAQTLCGRDAAVARLGRDEAVAVGMLALVRAAVHFRPELGWRFSTYATNAILSEIRRAAADQSVVHVPPGVHGREYGASPAAHARCRAAAAAAQRVCFADSGNPADGDPLGAAVFPPAADATPAVDRRLTAEALLAAPGILWQDAWAVRRYFYGGWPLARIARHLGVTRERARQLVGRGVHAIRVHLGLAKKGRAPGKVRLPGVTGPRAGGKG